MSITDAPVSSSPIVRGENAQSIWRIVVVQVRDHEVDVRGSGETVDTAPIYF